MFPAFDDRAANIYSAVYYLRDPGQTYDDLSAALFNAEEKPLSAVEQRETFQTILEDALEDECSYDVVQTVHEQLSERIKEQQLDLEVVKQVIVDYLRQSPHTCFAVAYDKVATTAMPPQLRDRILMGYHPRRSGDIIYVPEPGYYDYGSWSSPVGTTHGEWNPYDSHIPLLFYGWKVQHGATSREVHITDIAPTICQLLHIQQPNACVGEAIMEITK
jgi:hypothetical protein